jgi:plastocyanin
MVHSAPFVGAVALLASAVAAVPMPQYGSSGSYSSYSGDNQQNQNSATSTSAAYSTSTYSQGYSSSTSSQGYSSSTYSQGYSSSSTYSSQYSTSTDAATSTQLATSTSSSSYSMPSYGSGSSYWGGSSYNDCVQQCMAEYGDGMSSVSNTYSGSSADSGSSGSNGVTHTVMVAPTQGVYRYVPFYVSANVGDTVQFIWGSGPHTVTKSSALEICNKTQEAPVFASGAQNKSFIFNEVVNDTNPVFFYCGVKDHCERGMFGMINANTTTSSTSVSSMMSSMLSNNSVLSAMYSYQQNVSNGNSAADSWGSDLDMSGMPQWSQEYTMQNVMYTRTFLAANPEVINSDGTIDMSKASSWSVPNDVAAQLTDAQVAAAASPSSSSSTSSTSSGSAPATTSAHSGAGSVTAPRLATAFAAIAVAVLAL